MDPFKKKTCKWSSVRRIKVGKAMDVQERGLIAFSAQRGHQWIPSGRFDVLMLSHQMLPLCNGKNKNFFIILDPPSISDVGYKFGSNQTKGAGGVWLGRIAENEQYDPEAARFKLKWGPFRVLSDFFMRLLMVEMPTKFHSVIFNWI